MLNPLAGTPAPRAAIAQAASYLRSALNLLTASSIRRTEMAGQPGGHEEPDADLPHHLRRGFNPMPDAKELLHSNLHEVFSERDPQRRWAAIERTYTEDVTFIDPEGEFIGWQALSDQAQKLLDGLLAGFVFEEDGPQYVGADTAALEWRVGPPGKPIARGIDIVTIRDGRLSVVRTLTAADTDA
jgi:SnoaL-like domain